MSFVNCQKYPPSLDFLLMTLGPALVLLALVDRPPGPVGELFIVFGRVPLFFYLLHWFVIKGVALGLSWWEYGRVDFFFDATAPRPHDFGFDLIVVYAVWVGVIAFFFPLCWWYSKVKQRSRSVWLSYL
jgi:hypothetical protein